MFNKGKISKLNKCLDEIDQMIYDLRFVDFISKNELIDFLYELLTDIRKICQYKDIDKFKEELKANDTR